jgi:hypothetical protein
MLGDLPFWIMLILQEDQIETYEAACARNNISLQLVFL